MFKLPDELMGKLVENREKTGKSLALQVREAVRKYCKEKENGN
jgi:predicted DNA-binding protein